MNSLGGSIFIRNAIKLAYCIEEAVLSLIPICDEVIVGDAQSTDGTLDILRRLEKDNANVRVIEGLNWECADDYNRLNILANEVKNNLKTDWHFMLQADEVLHENSYDKIRGLINHDGPDGYMCRRYNFYGNIDRYIRFDIVNNTKPCSDRIMRLAKTHCNAHGDAESLQIPNCNIDHVDSINIFHYGMVRDKRIFVDKVIDMQSWFHGPDGTPDHRVVAMKENNEEFSPWKCKNIEDTTELTMVHPKVAHNLVKRLRR